MGAFSFRNPAVGLFILAVFPVVGKEQPRVSFFDEADEPPRTESRTQTRSTPRPRRSGSGGGRSGGRRRPPAGPSQQSVNTRRGIALVALVIVIVLITIGVSSCDSSARRSALENYGDNVNTIINKSDATSATLFHALSGANSGNASSVSQSVAEARQSAEQVLSQAEHLSVPSAVRQANSRLVLVLQLRVDGLANITNEIGAALGNSANQQAVQQITAQMARFYASDVLYKSYVVPEIVEALHADNITVGGQDGTPINGGQFLPSITWLQPSSVGAALGVPVSSKSGTGSGATKVTGLHGDSINSVSVDGVALTSAGNSIAASPPPTFAISFTNGGNFTETDVGCKVTVTGTSVEGTAVVPSIAKGATATCNVTLRSAPPAGNYNVVATVEKVPGETNMSNNTLSYPVTFK